MGLPDSIPIDARDTTRVRARDHRVALEGNLATRGAAFEAEGYLLSPADQADAMLVTEVSVEELTALRRRHPETAIILFSDDPGLGTAAYDLPGVTVAPASFLQSEAALLGCVARRLQEQRDQRELSRRRDASDQLLTITRDLARTLDLHALFFALTRHVASAAQTERVSIMLGQDGDDLAYVIAASDDERLHDHPVSLASYPEVQEVLRTGQPLIIEDAQHHPLLSLPSVSLPPRFRAMALFPVAFQGRTLGALFLRFPAPRRLDAETSWMIETISNAAGIALRNASVMQRVREEAERSETEHARQMKALQPYAAFFDASADGIVVLDGQDRILFCNPSAARLLGAPPGLIRGTSFYELLDDDEGRSRYRRQRDGASTLERAHVDLGVRTVDDRRAVLSAGFSAADRTLGTVVVSMRDVTEERALARELNKTKEFLQRVIDSSVDAIVSADLDGNILLYNPAAERTLGLSAEEVIGRITADAIYRPGVAQRVMQLIRSEGHGGAGVLEGHETELVGRGGRRIPVLLSAALIHHRGQVIGSVGVFRDLRQRRAIEAELADAQRELAEREQRAFIAELAGATAHELIQPLTAVLGYASLVQRQVADDERIERAMAAIVSETERMAEIVRKIGRLTKHASKDYIGDTKIVDIEASADSDRSPTFDVREDDP